jgi:hypothetical protein
MGIVTGACAPLVARAATGLAVAALTMVGPACSGGDDGDRAVLESRPTTDDVGDDGAANDRDRGASGSGTTPSPGTGDEPAADPEVLGTARAELPNVSLGIPGRSLPMRVDVTGLQRNGSRVELTFAVTNEAAPEETDDDPGTSESPSFELTLRFVETPGEPQTSDEPDDVSGVELVDGAGGTHGPASDDGGRCLCSDGLTAQYIDPGDSTDFVATFGDLPADVTTVDVHVPGFPAITALPIAG